MPFTNPFEMFKDDYYRVVHSEEEVASLVKKGWSDVQPDNHPYIPFSAHPGQVELTAKKAAAEKALALQKQMAAQPAVEPMPTRPAVMPPPIPMIEPEVKRGPGRPPNPKAE